MPGFTSQIVDIEDKNQHVNIIVHIDWFLENIIIWAHLKFHIDVDIKVKKIDGIDRAVRRRVIDFTKIPLGYKVLLSDAMLMSIKSRLETQLNAV